MSGSQVARVGESGSAVERFMSEFAGSEAPIGLEDVGAGDVAMSKVSIVHDKGVFLDSLTGEEYESLDTVLLGLVKGRVMWDTDLDAKDGPMCRSKDGHTGTPQNNFPHMVFREKGGVYRPDETTVECSTCVFAQWGSHPKNDTPWCAEQMTFPLTLPGNDEKASGLVTFQRSGLTKARAYISAFMRESKPMFTHRTTITLEMGKKGSVVFSTPKFVRGEEIQDLDQLRSFAEQYAAIRKVIGGEAAESNRPQIAVVVDKGWAGKDDSDPWGARPSTPPASAPPF